MKSLSLQLCAVFILSVVLQAFVSILADGLKVSHPDCNPIRDALQPVPETAIFKMEGYCLWDPSLIKVGDTYHLFASRWPVTSERMEGWKKSHVIRASSKSRFGSYQFQEVVLSPVESFLGDPSGPQSQGDEDRR